MAGPPAAQTGEVTRLWTYDDPESYAMRFHLFFAHGPGR
jgi:hypothetical protein